MHRHASSEHDNGLRRVVSIKLQSHLTPRNGPNTSAMETFRWLTHGRHIRENKRLCRSLKIDWLVISHVPDGAITAHGKSTYCFKLYNQPKIDLVRYPVVYYYPGLITFPDIDNLKARCRSFDSKGESLYCTESQDSAPLLLCSAYSTGFKTSWYPPPTKYFYRKGRELTAIIHELWKKTVMLCSFDNSVLWSYFCG
jgi:hypothetical protein